MMSTGDKPRNQSSENQAAVTNISQDAAALSDGTSKYTITGPHAHEQNTRVAGPPLDCTDQRPPIADGHRFIANSITTHNVAYQTTNISSSLTGVSAEPVNEGYQQGGGANEHRRLAQTVDTDLSGFGDSASLFPTELRGEVRGRELEDLARMQHDVPSTLFSSSYRPKLEHFTSSISMRIIPPDVDEEVTYADRCFIFLANSTDTEDAVESLAFSLRKLYMNSAFILLLGPRPLSPNSRGSHLADTRDFWDRDFLNPDRIILEDIIKHGLMEHCHFQSRDIVLLGDFQGGTMALTIAALWDGIEFGGVVSIGGPLPSDTNLPSITKAKTPALIVGGELGAFSVPNSLQKIKETFICVDTDIKPKVDDAIPSKKAIRPLLDFLAHRLRREEWIKQAVICFDGGGIRGYGSLLILKDLMLKIGKVEKRLGAAESSFAPCIYKPTKPGLDDGDFGTPVATRSEGLPNSALFLPCHYFTYAAGTSTGGLITIMLSRFRMTVDDCIKEYKTLGAKVFGNPRRFSKGAIIRHKYSSKNFEEVVRDLSSRYSEMSHFEVNFGPIDEDLCGSMVLAYAENTSAPLVPYLFRTYHTTASVNKEKSKLRQKEDRNLGGPSILHIAKVARATSAAPGYFEPVEIPKGDDAKEVTRFKDGGFGSNNPSEEAYQDVKNKHGGLKRNMGPFVSIGTGIPEVELFSKKKGNLHNTHANFKAAKKFPSSTTIKVHEHMIAVTDDEDPQDSVPYYRFDGGKTLGEIALDEWKSHRFTRFTHSNSAPGAATLEKIERATRDYLSQPEVEKDLQECAEILVKRRLLRARHDSKWDRYASCSYYMCDERGCQRNRIDEAEDFKKHMRSEHRVRISDQDLDEQIRKRRHCGWIYRQSAAPIEPLSSSEGNGSP